jgi:branched-subunit amino acid transport protein
VKLASSDIWLTILALMVLIILMRCGVLVLPRKFQPKGNLAEALGFAPLAALVAICAPEIAKFQMQALTQGASFPLLLTGLRQDWRLWGAMALIVTVLLTRNSKRAALYGLSAAASIVWWI